MGKEILSAEGFEVSTVSNGQAAAKILKQFAPDLVLADVFMPGRNGYELCQLIKSDPDLQHIPVVLIIGKMEPYDEVEGRKAGADAVITKPLESSSLIETVQRLLAAVQKPAPPPAPPEPASIEEPPEEEPDEEENPSPETERMWTSAKEQLEIPDELGTQAFSVFGDLLESSDEAAPEANLSPETPAMEMELEAAPSPVQTILSARNARGVFDLLRLREKTLSMSLPDSGDVKQQGHYFHMRMCDVGGKSAPLAWFLSRASMSQIDGMLTECGDNAKTMTQIAELLGVMPADD